MTGGLDGKNATELLAWVAAPRSAHEGTHFLLIWPCATPLLKNVRTSLGQPSALMYLGINYPKLI
jgi:hypothetical protein